jgi:regulator of replication initiation timing
MDNTTIEQAAEMTAENLKNLLLHLISEIRRLESENEQLRQQLGK